MERIQHTLCHKLSCTSNFGAQDVFSLTFKKSVEVGRGVGGGEFEEGGMKVREGVENMTQMKGRTVNVRKDL